MRLKDKSEIKTINGVKKKKSKKVNKWMEEEGEKKRKRKFGGRKIFVIQGWKSWLDLRNSVWDEHDLLYQFKLGSSGSS